MTDFQTARQDIVQAARHLLNRGFLSATGGNLSLRCGSDGLVVTPSNFDYAHMVAEDVCVLDYDLNLLLGEHKPSVESAMHAAIYRVRPDVNAIVHTHQVYPSTLAIIKKPIPALFDEQVRFLGRSVDIIPYAPSGTSMLKNTVARHVRNNNNAYIMANHGALVFGTDLERALHNVEILEKCSLAYLLSLCSEEKVSKIPLAIREVAFSKLRSDQKKAAAGNEN